MPKVELIKPANLKAYLRSLNDRMAALKTLIVQEAAAAFLDDVKDAAQGDKSGGYAQLLKLRRIRVNDKNAKFMVMVSEANKPIRHVKPEAVYYYRSPTGANTPLLGVLKKYEPYTKAYLPLAADPKRYRLIFKLVTGDEVEEVEARLAVEFGSVVAELMTTKVDPSRILHPGNASLDTKAVENLAFRVIREEFGINANRRPVWRPAIEKFKSASRIKSLMEQGQTKKILCDVSYSGWKSIDNVKDDIPDSETKKFDDFQRKILP